MATYNLPDYKEKYFEYKDLDKIHGQPTIESIIKLLRQVKRNAQCVPTTLGGGQLGYLALVLTPAAYNAIATSALFIRPTDPGIFAPIPHPGVATRAGVPPPLSAADIATQKIAHDERKRTYNECQAVESTLRNQIIKAIDETYTRPLRDTTTDMITSSITAIFTFLQATYGKLSPSQLKQRENAVDDLIFDPSTNVDTVFNKIEDFQALCTLIGRDKTDSQLVDMAYLVFQKTGIFQHSLKDWNNKSTDDQTFAEFKTFMRKEYLDLEAVGGLTVNNAMESQANMIKELKEHNSIIAQELKDELRESMLHTLQAFNVIESDENVNPNIMGYDHQQSFIPQFHQFSQPIIQQQPDQQMLAVKSQHDNTINELLKQMATMQSQIKNLTMVAQPSINQNQGHLSQNSDNINPKTGKPWRRYCWSCGCCPHWGKHCPQKKRGHKDEASFRNRMGGSSKNCL